MGNIDVIVVRDMAEQRSADPETESRIVREPWELFYAAIR